MLLGILVGSLHFVLDVLDEFVVRLATCMAVRSKPRVVGGVGALVSVSLAAVRFPTTTGMASVSTRVGLRLLRALRGLLLRNLELLEARVAAVGVGGSKLLLADLSFLDGLVVDDLGVLVGTFVSRTLSMRAVNGILLILVIFHINGWHEPIEVHALGAMSVSLPSFATIRLMANLTGQSLPGNGLFGLDLVFVSGLALVHFHVRVLELVLLIPFRTGIFLRVGLSSRVVILFATLGGVDLRLLVAR